RCTTRCATAGNVLPCLRERHGRGCRCLGWTPSPRAAVRRGVVLPAVLRHARAPDGERTLAADWTGDPCRSRGAAGEPHYGAASEAAVATTPNHPGAARPPHRVAVLRFAA